MLNEKVPFDYLFPITLANKITTVIYRVLYFDAVILILNFFTLVLYMIIKYICNVSVVYFKVPFVLPCDNITLSVLQFISVCSFSFIQSVID